MRTVWLRLCDLRRRAKLRQYLSPSSQCQVNRARATGSPSPSHALPFTTESCRKSGLDRVTVQELERIRARMPTPKMFG